MEGTRVRSLRAVLAEVHAHGRVSRAEVTRATGLNRSTVADVSAELVQRGLVRETDPVATSRAGRPSPTIESDPRAVVVAINPEADAVTAALVGLNARVLRRGRHPLDAPATPDDTVAAIERVLGAARGLRVLGVGVAVPGPVRESGVVHSAPHLGWTEVSLRARIEQSTGLRTVVGNDASLGAVAEHRFGAGRGVGDLVYLNGGASGIGGGIVADGRLLGGRDGFAGEFGQSRAAFLDPVDAASAERTLESEVSRGRLLALLSLAQATDAELAAALAAAGADAAVRAELARQRRVLAVALGSLTNTLDPALVVLGGYLAAVAASDPEELAGLTASVTPTVPVPPIVPAALGEDRLLVGAAEAALAPILADPTLAPPH